MYALFQAWPGVLVVKMIRAVREETNDDDGLDLQ